MPLPCQSRWEHSGAPVTPSPAPVKGTGRLAESLPGAFPAFRPGQTWRPPAQPARLLGRSGWGAEAGKPRVSSRWGRSSALPPPKAAPHPPKAALLHLPALPPSSVPPSSLLPAFSLPGARPAGQTHASLGGAAGGGGSWGVPPKRGQLAIHQGKEPPKPLSPSRTPGVA